MQRSPGGVRRLERTSCPLLSLSVKRGTGRPEVASPAWRGSGAAAGRERALTAGTGGQGARGRGRSPEVAASHRDGAGARGERRSERRGGQGGVGDDRTGTVAMETHAAQANHGNW